ncbi:phospholipase effector Tle1 domain-containing protein [Mycolicibacterium litorale]|uniref:phospholipase effector Tle1 domain-containing protein n=1 Tax=Mycolicibacterium litorale TaxID=758802 RepID=UPI003CF12906
MKNIVMCFDRTQDHPGRRASTNAGALFGLVESSPRQLTWYDPGAAAQPLARGVNALRWRQIAAESARTSIVDAYRFLVDVWTPGDAVYLFGVGRGASCARELARLLGTIGVWHDRRDQLLDYLLDAYVLPRADRTAADWVRVSRLAASLTGRRTAAVPVRYLGLWDAVTVPGVARTDDGLSNVTAGRHAIAIDGGRFGERVDARTVDEVWFRGAHCDVAGSRGACWQLADIPLDWVLDGAVRAGVLLRGGCRLPTPTEFDALAGSSHPLSMRRLPEDAHVHASVELYLRAHPQYWRRLPARVQWADAEWLARGERLVHIRAPLPITPSAPRELVTAAR